MLLLLNYLLHKANQKTLYAKNRLLAKSQQLEYLKAAENKRLDSIDMSIQAECSHYKTQLRAARATIFVTETIAEADFQHSKINSIHI